MIRCTGKGPLDSHKEFAGLKGAASAIPVTDELLTRINGFALEPLAAEDVFIGKQILAHNGIDRDLERFTEDLLEQFAATLPGKSVLYFHDRRGTLPLGLYFDAQTETLSVEKFKALTGADPRLPDGIDQVKVLWAWYYVVKTDEVDFVLKNIVGGTYRHWSIGFTASDLVAVKAEANGPTLCWEYVGPGEALEGSLVWLGAQQGASSQKSAGKPTAQPEGDEPMKNLLQLLGVTLGKSFGDDTTEEALAKAVKDALTARDNEIDSLKGQVDELAPMAEIGKKHRDHLASEFARMKAALGECDSTDEASEKMKSFAAGLDIAFLENEVKHLSRRMEEKFPDGQLDGGDPNSNRGGGSGEKNPLVPENAA
ncbi:MAG: hypothetical protein Tsb0017_27480 [Geothermobacteraceae bacterium]